MLAFEVRHLGGQLIRRGKPPWPLKPSARLESSSYGGNQLRVTVAELITLKAPRGQSLTQIPTVSGGSRLLVMVNYVATG